jgi:hypothetical protein
LVFRLGGKLRFFFFFWPLIKTCTLTDLPPQLGDPLVDNKIELQFLSGSLEEIAPSITPGGRTVSMARIDGYHSRLPNLLLW